MKDTKTDQQARQVDFAGKHGRFFEGDNIVGASQLFDKTVLSMNVDNLKTGEEAICQIDLNSESTQHTALASLSLQMLDLHENNIGINSDKEFLLFDTDHLMFENNNYFEAVDLDGELRANSPLGHNYLQTLDIKIEDLYLRSI